MDRVAVARRQRRKHVEQALEEERGREEALAEQLDAVVAEVEGPRLDELAFARMQPEDVAIVRDALGVLAPFEGDEVDETELDGAGADEEIARLQDEIADSQRRQRAYASYLQALE